MTQTDEPKLPESSTSDENFGVVPDPRFVLQLVMSRDSDEYGYLMDATLWTWTDLTDPGVTESLFFCESCWGPVVDWVCCRCHRVYDVDNDPENGPMEGATLTGTAEKIGEQLQMLIHAMDLDVDVGLIYFRESFKDNHELRMHARKPLEELLDSGEFKLYKRDVLSVDSLSGARLATLLTNFVRA